MQLLRSSSLLLHLLLHHYNSLGGFLRSLQGRLDQLFRHCCYAIDGLFRGGPSSSSCSLSTLDSAENSSSKLETSRRKFCFLSLVAKRPSRKSANRFGLLLDRVASQNALASSKQLGRNGAQVWRSSPVQPPRLHPRRRRKQLSKGGARGICHSKWCRPALKALRVLGLWVLAPG